MAKRVGVIGLGLIGGSLALAIKRARPGEFVMLGYTRTKANAAKASSLGIVDEVADSPESAAKADLVILSTPIMATRGILQQISGCLPSGCIVTDVASTKVQMMKWADEYLPRKVSFVGGHPMAGKEISGVGAAEAGLFEGRTYCLVPGERTTSKSLDWMTGLVRDIGATPLVIGAPEHDDFVAGVSHLPFFVSAALVSATANSSAWSQMSQFAAGGYRDTTRLASQSPEMGRDMCLTNQDNILRWIDRFVQELGRFRETIASDPKAVEGMLAAARQAREQWLEAHEW